MKLLKKILLVLCVQLVILVKPVHFRSLLLQSLEHLFFPIQLRFPAIYITSDPVSKIPEILEYLSCTKHMDLDIWFQRNLILQWV